MQNFLLQTLVKKLISILPELTSSSTLHWRAGLFLFLFAVHPPLSERWRVGQASVCRGVPRHSALCTPRIWSLQTENNYFECNLLFLPNGYWSAWRYKNTWEEIDFLGPNVLESSINDCWQLRPPLWNSLWSCESCIALTGHPPVNSAKNKTKKLQLTNFVFTFILFLHKRHAYPFLKKCSSPLITVMESNMFTAQASWLGSTGGGVGSSVGGDMLLVTSGSDVGPMGGLGVGLGPVLLPAKSVVEKRNAQKVTNLFF